MFKNISETIITRFVNALISFIITIIISRRFGAEGTGTIGLIVLGITIIVLVNNFIGGSGLVYLIPRYGVYNLLITSYIWALITSVPVSIILGISKLIPSGYTFHVFLLAFLFSLTSINQMIMLGKEKIKPYNIISMLQMIVLIISLMLFIKFYPQKGINAYIYALYCAYIFAFLFSSLYIKKIISFTSLAGVTKIIKETFKLGVIFQTANLLQLLNYRLSYYLIDLYTGRGNLGVYNIGVQVSESVWNIPKSLSTIIYSKISNSDDKNYSINLTLGFLKLSLAATSILLLIIIVIPKSFYVFIFSSDFINVKQVMIWLSPGILAISGGMILSHYFSGSGKAFHNTISSAIGVIFTILFCILLIPEYGLSGAALAATLSYCASTLYQIIIFCKTTKCNLINLLPVTNDIKIIKKEIKKCFNKSN